MKPDSEQLTQNQPIPISPIDHHLHVIPLLIISLSMFLIGITGGYLLFGPKTSKPQAMIPKLESQIRQYDLINVPLAQDLEKAKYTTIPGTDLQIKIPESYTLRKQSVDINLPITNVLSAQTDIAQKNDDVLVCKEHLWDNPSWISSGKIASYITPEYCSALLATNPVLPNPDYPILNANSFAISVIATTSSPANWLLDSYVPQGTNLRQDPSLAPIEQQRMINQTLFYAYRIGCCGQGEDVYLYPYSYKNAHLLIIFTNVDVLPILNIPDTFIESILTTLKK